MPKKKFDEKSVTRAPNGRFAKSGGGGGSRLSLKDAMAMDAARVNSLNRTQQSKPKPKPAVRQAPSPVSRPNSVTNKGLLTSNERLRLNPNSTLQGPAIKARPGEGRESLNRRARKAAHEFRTKHF